MIHYIKGYITDIMPGAVAIENNGLAFYVNVPDNSFAFIAPKTEQIILYTHMIVREDDISLYGFTDKASLALFKLLLTVSGIGAKAALAILSVGTASAIKQAIAFEDVDTIQLAQGVGKKTAQRVVLELKDKLDKNEDLVKLSVETTNVNLASDDKDKAAAVSALMALGYSKTEAMSALIGIDASSTEEYIAKALRNK